MKSRDLHRELIEKAEERGYRKAIRDAIAVIKSWRAEGPSLFTVIEKEIRELQPK